MTFMPPRLQKGAHEQIQTPKHGHAPRTKKEKKQCFHIFQQWSGRTPLRPVYIRPRGLQFTDRVNKPISDPPTPWVNTCQPRASIRLRGLRWFLSKTAMLGGPIEPKVGLTSTWPTNNGSFCYALFFCRFLVWLFLLILRHAAQIVNSS